MDKEYIISFMIILLLLATTIKKITAHPSKCCGYFN